MIDAHAHLDGAYGGGWIDRPLPELIDVLDAVGIDVLVDLSGGWGLDVLHHHLDHFKATHPDRFVHLGGIDWRGWPELGDGFGEAAARSLQDQLRRGAGGLKVWKTLGLEARDHRGRLVSVADPRLDPVWAVCAADAVPVVIHVGDPIEFFRPADADNPRADELVEHPEWHWHHLVPVGHHDLLDDFQALLERWPAVTFVGAHLLDLLHEPARLGRLLDRHANLLVDLGARFEELLAAGPELLAVATDHPDRLLYGMDHPPSVAQYERTIATTHTWLHEAGRAAGRLDRADATVRSVFQGNAARTFTP